MLSPSSGGERRTVSSPPTSERSIERIAGNLQVGEHTRGQRTVRVLERSKLDPCNHTILLLHSLAPAAASVEAAWLHQRQPRSLSLARRAPAIRALPLLSSSGRNRNGLWLQRDLTGALLEVAQR